jgi:DNA-binding SARP family transcriptional activator
MNVNSSTSAKASKQALPLHVHLLGNFRLFCGGTPVNSIDTPRLQSLLAYLVLHRGAPLSRQHVAFMLWPDSSEAHARGSLRKLLFQLTGALPQPDRFLDVNAQTLQWRPDAPFTLDVEEFEKAVDGAASAAALQAALALYRGDLLPSAYDDWILTERERLQQTFLSALERLILLLESERDYANAIDCAQALLRHDPLHEETYLHLMRLYAVTLNRAGALRTYHTCATLLQRELNVEPSPATRRVYEQIVNLHESPPSAATLVAAAPLVGRQEEWARLQQVWRQASAGEPCLALISGEAGIGKTRLAEEMMDWARRQGIATASARCYAAEGGLAYAPLAAWLRSRPLPPLAPHWQSEIARVLPELLGSDGVTAPPGPLTEKWQRQHLFDALIRAILEGSQPLLLMMDDIQWSDRETLEWLHYLLRSEARARLMVLATMRPEELGDDHALSALLAALRRNDQLAEIELKPFGPGETAALARQITGRELDQKLAARLYQETEGNALFVVEFLRARIVEQSEQKDEQPVSVLPPTVQSVLRARLAQLSPSARELASLAASVGREFTFDVLQQVSGYEVEILVRALDELWHRRIMREHGTTGYDFSHDKLREVIYADLSTARRRLVHSRIAKALQTLHASNLGAVSGEIATHLERAGSLEEAIPFYERAAEAAQRVSANQDALALYHRGLELIGRVPEAGQLGPFAVRLEAGCGDLLELLGRHDEARAAYRAALTYLSADDSLGAARFERKIGNTDKSQGRYEEAMESYGRAEAALSQAPGDLAPSGWDEWIELQFDQFDLNYGRADLSEMVRLAERVKPRVEQHGTHFQRARLYLLFVQINLRRDRYVISDETLAYARAAVAAVEQSGDPTRKEALRFALGFALLWRGELEEAEEQLLAAREWDEQIGYAYEKTLALTYLTILYRKRGQAEQVRHYAAQALETATSSDLPSYIATAYANQAWAAWRENKYKEARAKAEAALRLWPSSYPFQWTALFPLIAVFLRRNQIAQAIGYTRLLSQPLQQRLPDALTASLEQAIRAWDHGQFKTARNYIRRTLELSRETGYL